MTNIRQIKCKCPKCAESFTLGDALNEQALQDAITDVISELNKDYDQRLEKQKSDGVALGKKLAADEGFEQLKRKQAELDKLSLEITEGKTRLLEQQSQINRLKNGQDELVRLRLAEQKLTHDQQRSQKEQEYKQIIQKLNSDLKSALQRSNQGSMQAQGEASELLVEETLAELFPRDEVVEIKKGQRGADCLLVVKTATGRTVGKILFECKDTKNFSGDWVPKLKSDAISEGADISVLITNAWPSDANRAHQRDGVWVCGYSEYTILVRALRQSLLDMARVTAAEEARDSKSQVMFDFLTSQEFAHTIEQMISPIFRMHEQLEKERRAMNRIWKERQALIDSSINGTESLYMKIQGIAQINLPSVSGMEPLENLLDNSESE